MSQITARSFLGVLDPATGGSPRANVTLALRLLGFVVLASFAVSVLRSLAIMSWGAALAAGAIFGLIVAAVLAAAALFWLTYARRMWLAGRPEGASHTMIIAIVAIILGAIDLLGRGGFGMIYGLGPGYALLHLLGLLALLLAVAQVALGVWLLLERNKATPGA
ncbi:MAG TPA: hypothetical protein VFH47_07395 [Candidatus Thermoplasmatota archaeon]|nr:hypothetical protein [Candidatus Thermoplasmatota archaeon]